MTIKTTMGQLKQAIKATLVAVNSKRCDLHIKDGQVYVQATSHSGFCRVIVSTEGSSSDIAVGSISVHAANVIFGSVAADMEVTFKPQSKGIRLRFGGSNLTLVHTDAGEAVNDLFEVTTHCTGKTLLASATGAQLAKAFDTVQYFAAKGDVRQYLCGVLIEKENELLKLTATNGFSLNSVTSDVEIKKEGEFQAILPSDAAQAFDMVFKPDDEVDIFQLGTGDTRRMVWKTKNICWLTTLVAGAFPGYRSILAGETSPLSKTWNVARKPLAAAISRVHAMSGDRYLKFILSNESITVQSPDQLQREVVELDQKLDDIVPFECIASFAGEMLLDCMDQVPSEVVAFKKEANPTSKLYLRPVADGAEVQEWIALIQPASI